MNKRPLLVGVTGGIGAGKSVVCKIFSQLEIPVYDADSRAKWLMGNDITLVRDIQAQFGAESYDASNKLNREYLAKYVFSDAGAREKLNNLVHPKVGQDFDHWVKANLNSPYLIKEAALLFESGAYQALDEVIAVTAGKDIRIERVLMRDTQRSKKQIMAIIESQMSENQRKKMAGHLIRNDGTQLVIPQVLSLHQKFTNQSAAR